MSQIGIIIIPEEAEALLPVVRNAKPPMAFLLTYAAPVTRRMSTLFNDFRYYTVPAVPADWKAPLWLKAQVGLFAGRLYFEWEEYHSLLEFLGISGTEDSRSENEVQSGDAPVPQTDGAGGNGEHVPAHTNKSVAKAFVSNPLTFLQEWLAVRRRGQDFANTPLGFVSQKKELDANHPFFRQEENADRAGLFGVARGIAEKTEEIEQVVFEGGVDVPLDDLDSDNESDSEIEYHDDELYSKDESEEDSSAAKASSEEEETGRGRRGGNGSGGRGRGRGGKGGQGHRGRG